MSSPCPQCGNVNRSSESQCVKCGASLKPSLAHIIQPPQPITVITKKRRIWPWVLFGLFVVGLLGTAVEKVRDKVVHPGFATPSPITSVEPIDTSPAARLRAADRMERKMLSDGMDTHFSLSGPEKTTLTIRYVLMSRPMVYKITTETDFLDALKKVGFKKVIFTDGYNESWSYGL